MYKREYQLKTEMYDDIQAMGGDAFKILGFGLIAYRNILRSLAITFFIMSIVFYPVLNLYHSGTAT